MSKAVAEQKVIEAVEDLKNSAPMTEYRDRLVQWFVANCVENGDLVDKERRLDGYLFRNLYEFLNELQ